MWCWSKTLVAFYLVYVSHTSIFAKDHEGTTRDSANRGKSPTLKCPQNLQIRNNENVIIRQGQLIKARSWDDTEVSCIYASDWAFNNDSIRSGCQVGDFLYFKLVIGETKLVNRSQAVCLAPGKISSAISNRHFSPIPESERGKMNSTSRHFHSGVYAYGVTQDGNNLISGDYYGSFPTLPHLGIKECPRFIQIVNERKEKIGQALLLQEKYWASVDRSSCLYSSTYTPDPRWSPDSPCKKGDTLLLTGFRKKGFFEVGANICIRGSEIARALSDPYFLEGIKQPRERDTGLYGEELNLDTRVLTMRNFYERPLPAEKTTTQVVLGGLYDLVGGLIVGRDMSNGGLGKVGEATHGLALALGGVRSGNNMGFGTSRSVRDMRVDRGGGPYAAPAELRYVTDAAGLKPALTRPIGADSGR